MPRNELQKIINEMEKQMKESAKNPVGTSRRLLDEVMS
jgi:hypothetical protein